mgnify:CR=1 FL=1
MNVFSFDSPFMSFLTKAAEYMLVCLLCALFSLPVFTAGAAVTAAYYVGMKLIRGEDAGFFKAYIKGFKDNFKQATGFPVITGTIIYFLFYHNNYYNFDKLKLLHHFLSILLKSHLEL